MDDGVVALVGYGVAGEVAGVEGVGGARAGCGAAEAGDVVALGAEVAAKGAAEESTHSCNQYAGHVDMV